MTHTLASLDITTRDKWLSAEGYFSKGKPWKGIKLSAENYTCLCETASLKGWSKVEKVTAAAEDTRSEEDYLSDVGVCKYYLYKYESSKTRGIQFDLSLAQFKSIMKRKRCYYTGELLVRGRGHRSTFTLDRIDSSVGYTKDNTVPCAEWVNQLKNILFEDKGSNVLTDKKTLVKILSKL